MTDQIIIVLSMDKTTLRGGIDLVDEHVKGARMKWEWTSDWIQQHVWFECKRKDFFLFRKIALMIKAGKRWLGASVNAAHDCRQLKRVLLIHNLDSCNWKEYCWLIPMSCWLHAFLSCALKDFPGIDWQQDRSESTNRILESSQPVAPRLNEQMTNNIATFKLTNQVNNQRQNTHHFSL